ncbi:MAG: phosphatidate cytidylyltransferase [Armatimonadota bacterium]|nr:MAG: phosphatidate cytidylyltransferase [Armatimonadota bacterium]
MTELAKRVLTAMLGIPVFLLALVGPPASLMPTGSTWTVLVMLIALMGVVEMLSAVERKYPEVRANRLLAMLSVYLPLDAWLSSHPQASFLQSARLFVVAIVLVALAWEVWRAENLGRLCVWRNVSTAALVVLYPGLLLSLWVKLRLIDAGCAQPVAWLSDGVRLILLTCVSVWVCDSAAYFVGKRFGRRRMSPLLSPRKSWEGAAAGTLFGTVAAGVTAVWTGLSPVSAILLGLVAVCLGQIGDLFESALKRELEIKDFGGFLPGHGGVMDRLDSLLFALPVVYLLSHFLPICS